MTDMGLSVDIVDGRAHLRVVLLYVVCICRKLQKKRGRAAYGANSDSSREGERANSSLQSMRNKSQTTDHGRAVFAKQEGVSSILLCLISSHRMEEDLFQGDLQDYLENGNLYERCYFQWSLVQCLVFEKHLLLEMHFPEGMSSDGCGSTEYSRQITKVLERAVNAVIKGSLIKSLCFTQDTTVEDVKTVVESLPSVQITRSQISHGKCSILVAYNLDLAQQSIQSFFFDVFRVNII